MASAVAEGPPSQEHVNMVESLPQGPLGADGTSHTSSKLESKSKLGGLRTNSKYLEFGSQSSKPWLTETQIFLFQDPHRQPHFLGSHVEEQRRVSEATVDAG